MTVGIAELPPEGMQLGGVALAGDTDRGTKTTEGLSLLFTAAGITVQGPQPQIERLLVWSGLDSASCHEKIDLNDGRSAAVMELTSGGQSIRFLLPTETVSPGQAAYLDQALPAWLARYRSAVGPAATAAAAVEDAEAVATRQPVDHGAGAPSAGSSPQPAPPPPPPSGALPPMARPPMAAATGPAATESTNGSAGAPADQPVHAPAASAAPAEPTTPAAPAPPSPDVETGPVAPVAGRGPTRAGAPPAQPGPTDATPGWEFTSDPMPTATAWDDPPLGQVQAPDIVPPKRAKGWHRRRGHDDGVLPETAGPTTAAPTDAIPLGVILPPPSPDEPSVLLPPPPPSGAAPSETMAPPAPGDGLPDESPTGKPSKKGRRWRRGGVAATSAATFVVDGDAGTTDPGTGGAEVIEGSAPATAGDAIGTGPSIADGGGHVVPPVITSHVPDQPDLSAPQLVTVPDQPDLSAPQLVTVPEPGEPAGGRSRRTLTFLLVVVLLVVLGGVAYVLVKRHNSANTASTVVPPVTTVSPDVALATSINLRLADLPSGWARLTAGTPVTRMPNGPPAARLQASRTLSSCTGLPLATVNGLFAGGDLPGATALSTSPTFEQLANPTFQMFSTTDVLASAASVRPLTAALASPSFTTCFAQYQSALVAVSVAGGTAQVQAVALSAPTGVTAIGELTTVTLPGQSPFVVGQAFLFSGRIFTMLEPSTSGTSVPSDAFIPAYDAVTGRLAAAATR